MSQPPKNQRPANLLPFKRPPSTPDRKPATPHMACRGCGKTLELRGVTRLWPLPLDAHRYQPPLKRAVGEVVCAHCRYPHYLRFPTSQVTRNPFGMPDEVADRLSSFLIGRFGSDLSDPAEHFRDMARFYALAHRLALVNPPAQKTR